MQANSEEEEGYVFRFMQRQEYLDKKFAIKEDVSQFFRESNNCKIKTNLKLSEVKYCESVNGNYFLLKYFKYECDLC